VPCCDCGLYIDPVSDPARFATALVRRVPFSLLAQMTAIPADVGGIFAPRLPPKLWVLALAAVVALSLLIVPLLRGDAAARFFATGMLLSTWHDGIFVPFTPPTIGMTIHLAPAVGPLEQLAGSSLGEETRPGSR
jgi:hypothetical protein